MSDVARTQAIAALQAELARREDIRWQRSQALFGHPGAFIPQTHMSERERWNFLLDAYDETLARAFSEPSNASHPEAESESDSGESPRG